MKSLLYSRLILVTAISVCSLLKTQAAVQNIGSNATVNIPNNWNITTNNATTIAARTPSESIFFSLILLTENPLKKAKVENYEALNSYLEKYLNSYELEVYAYYVESGLPITGISKSPTFKGGVFDQYQFYSTYILREISLVDSVNTYNYLICHWLLSDGTNNFLIQIVINQDTASQNEIDEFFGLIEIKSSNIKTPLIDSDGDGVNNFDEIILYGTNPNLADAPQGTTYQGPTITSDLNSISLQKSQNIIPYAITTNFGANTFTASGLPSGIKLNARTGIATGQPTKKGTYNVRLTASKKQGKAITNSVTATKIVVVY